MRGYDPVPRWLDRLNDEHSHIVYFIMIRDVLAFSDTLLTLKTLVIILGVLASSDMAPRPGHGLLGLLAYEAD